MNTETFRRINDSYMEAYLGREQALRFKRRGRPWFSFPAFVFSFFWLFHKRLYREAAVFLAAVVIIPLIIAVPAGISRMEGDITFSSVYHELRRLPLKYTFTSAAGGSVIPSGITPYYEHEPAFRFWRARLAGTLAVNLLCGLSFNVLQKRKTEREILNRLSEIKSADRSAREDILRKAGEEVRGAPYSVLVFIMWTAVTLSHFYHTVYLPPRFFEWYFG